MPEPWRLISFVAVTFAVALVPGPAAAYCVAASLEARKLSLSAAVGVVAGKLVHLAFVAAGALWVLDLHPVVRGSMLAVAACFMLAQGLRRWLPTGAIGTHGRVPLRSSRLAQGLTVSVLNPQSLASAVAVVPLFVSDAISTAGAVILLGGAVMGAFAAYVVYEAIAMGAVRHLPTRSQSRMIGATYLVAATGLGLAALI